jgi:RNA polymerase sigma-70 factor, ECF subfamily
VSVDDRVVPAARGLASGLAGHRQLERTIRSEYGRVLSVLLRELRDFDLAEDALGDAIVEAAEHWSHGRSPEEPAAWLLTVARRRAIDRLRRRSTARRRAPLLVVPDADDPPEPRSDGIADERLRLLCTACHPALSRSAQVALTLRVVSGLRVREVAQAFLVSESAMEQRITRAKRKIRDAGIPYAVPASVELPRRLAAILAVVYLVFNEGHTASAGPVLHRVELQEEAIRLAELLHQILPDDTEAGGLLALLLLSASRRDARAAGGGPVPLPDQDRSRWDHDRLTRGVALARTTFARGTAGPYLLQAAIASVHAEAVSYDTTDWRRIVAYYDLLVEAADTPVVRLNRAIAVLESGAPAAALEQVDDLAPQLGAYHPWHATRAEILLRLGDTTASANAYRQAIERCDNEAVADHLRARLAQVSA